MVASEVQDRGGNFAAGSDISAANPGGAEGLPTLRIVDTANESSDTGRLAGSCYIARQFLGLHG